MISQMPRQKLIGSFTLALALFYLLSIAFLFPMYIDGSSSEFIDFKQFSFPAFSFYHSLVVDGFLGMFAGISLLRGSRVGYQLGILIWSFAIIFSIVKLVSFFYTYSFMEKSEDAQTFGIVLFLMQVTRIVTSALIIRHLSKELFKKAEVLPS